MLHLLSSWTGSISSLCSDPTDQRPRELQQPTLRLQPHRSAEHGGLSQVLELIWILCLKSEVTEILLLFLKCLYMVQWVKLNI